MRARAAVLAEQHFAGNPLMRGVGEQRSLADVLAAPAPPQLLLVAQRRVGVTAPDAGGAARLAWRSLQQVEAGGWRPEDEAFAVARAAEGDGAGEGGRQVRLPIYMLGEDAADGGVRLAVDVSALPPEQVAEQQQVQLSEVHSLMQPLPRAELAVAGHAIALAQWHAAHAFCGHCGAPTVPADGGMRRQCTAHVGHRHYPRTDPVVIMLVESPDGSRALLGRSTKHRPGMLTALAGFIDQGESIEEAVAREVREEAGVSVTQVDIVGTQPWPIGRGGSCELMIGALAKAAGEELSVNYQEMEEVRWVSRAEALAAVHAADDPDNPLLGGDGREGVFFIPPRYAIAHHLIKAWAELPPGRSWFESSAGASGGATGAGQERQGLTSSL
eukprot:scaffold1.g5196.t1